MVEADVPAEVESRLRARPAVGALLAAVAAAGVRAHVVGGAVRDALLGRADPAHPDVDVVVEGEMEPLAQGLGGQARLHDRFGTATVVGEHGLVDLVRARSETYAAPGALPEVSPADLPTDLARRDFTVNTFAVELRADGALGPLRSCDGAREDLEGRRLRVLHEASFVDDPTRLIRAVRYAVRLGFDFERETAALARAAVDGGAVATVSPARMGAELRLALREEPVLLVLALLDGLGAGRALFPDWRFDAGVVERALEMLPGDGRRDLLALACVVGPAAPLDAMEFSAPHRDVVAAVVSEAPGLAERLPTAGSEGGDAVAGAVGSAPVEAVALAGALGAEREARWWLEELRGVRLEIGGADLLAAGATAGPAVGRALAAALAAKRRGEVSGREAELAAALAALE